ncbi:MAG: hypothetical protein K2L02_04475 [Clostridia bacterium]|nr:hypothetical protein [Clostridia bacterium]
MDNQGEIEKNERPVCEDELTQEIFLLMKDYFNGKPYLRGKEIIYHLPNGQRFKISVQTD